MKLTCSFCKEKIIVEPFFYNPQITKSHIPFTEREEYYSACINYKFICPLCGGSNDQYVVKDIRDKDIIKLVIGD